MIGAETDEEFLRCVLEQAVNKDVVREVADDLRIMVYTPFHGCGYKLVPEALRRLGIKHLYPVEQQMVIDGSFPTVESPNPENPEGFYLAVDLAKRVNSDLIIGTDPDSDRIGTMVREQTANTVIITGNQPGVPASGLRHRRPPRHRHDAREPRRDGQHRPRRWRGPSPRRTAYTLRTPLRASSSWQSREPLGRRRNIPLHLRL